MWVHLKTDYPFLLNGILYFPKLKPDVDFSKGQIKLFCNQVFVSDNCDEIIPEFLKPLRGVIDSPDIPLNVSRSALTNDRTVRRIADFIAKKIGNRLQSLYEEDRSQYISAWSDVGTFVKYGAMRDEKFKKQVEDLIIYRTTYQPDGAVKEDTPKVEVQTDSGDAWSEVASDDQNVATEPYTTLKEYLERNKEKQENRVIYCSDPDTQNTYVELYKNQGLEVLFLDTFIDTNYFIPFLEREYSEVKFSRVDSELDDTLVDDDKAPTKLATNELKSYLKRQLTNPELISKLKPSNPTILRVLPQP